MQFFLFTDTIHSMLLERSQVPIDEKDPLAKERKLARNISRNLALRNATLTISILGTLHIGQIGDGIKDSIDWSTSVSTELPSIAVKGYLEKGFPHSIKELRKRRHNKVKDSSFWKEVVDYCKDTKTPVTGVNNHKAAVDTMRVFDGRVPKKFKPGKAKPSVIFSTEDEALAQRLASQGKNFLQSRFSSYAFRMMPEVAPLGSSEFVLQPKKPFPIVSVEDYDGAKYYSYQYKYPSKKSQPKVTPPGFILPTHYQMEYAEEDFREISNEHVDPYILSQRALDHLIRLRVDKTQVKGMLQAFHTLLNDPRSEGLYIRHLHIGGEFHNPNIAALLNSLFAGSERVRVYSGVDERTPAPLSGEHHMFASEIDAAEGLRATVTQHDHVVVHVEKTRQLFQKAANQIGDQTVRIGQLRQAERELLRTGKGELEYYLLEAFFQLTPPGSGLHFPDLLENFPHALAQKVKEVSPETSFQVDYLMNMYERRDEYFPQASKKRRFPFLQRG